MNFLYTLPDCPHCVKAGELLTSTDEPFKEVVVADPITELGIKSVLGKVIVPVLLRGNDFFWLVEVEPGQHKFVKLLSR